MGLLSFLSAAARAVYPFIQRGVREGLSIDRIGSAFRKEGFALSNATLRDLVHKERDLQTASNNLKFLRLDARPDPRRLPEALTAIRRLYSFTVEVRGVLSKGGTAVTQNVTVSTDKLLSRREIEAAALNAIDGGKRRYGIEVDSVQLVGGLKAGASGIL